MPRSKKPVKKRIILEDPLYSSRLVERLINKIMESGKKSIAQKIVYGAFEKIKESGKDPLRTFEEALFNASPKMEVRPRRIGGASYLVPMEVRGPRREALALKWIIAAAQKRASREFIDKNFKYPIMASKLASEILEASKNQGAAVSKKEEMHRVAEANKAFAHFRW
jgi:small subunit ribosomal protein S7